MTISNDTVAAKLAQYLEGRLPTSQLVDWAESLFLRDDVEFEPSNSKLLRDILAHAAASDVRAFGLTWDDCLSYLRQLGYTVHIEVAKTGSS